MRSWLQSAIGLTITAIVLAGCFVLFAVLLATTLGADDGAIATQHTRGHTKSPQRSVPRTP
jgi:hypothetical protein